MEVLHWKQKGFSGRELLLNSADEQIGTLVFNSWLSYNAVYTSGNNSISFNSKGWFDQDVAIVYNGQQIGTASVSSLTGKTQLRLLSGEFYTIKGDMFSYNRQVLNETGETVIKYKQGTFCFGKGTIEVSDTVSELTKEVLLSSSLYLKAVVEQQTAIMVTIFIPVFLNVLN